MIAQKVVKSDLKKSSRLISLNNIMYQSSCAHLTLSFRQHHSLRGEKATR